jgi:hypothetical protein
MCSNWLIIPKKIITENLKEEVENMKKRNRLVALFSALVLIISTLSVPVFAAEESKDSKEEVKVASDVAGKDCEVAVSKLKAVDVMAGYPNGDFKPEGNITRAEFAKIAVMAMGFGDAAKASEGVKSSKFKDVPAGKWYTGYVNVAENKGLISGYADGTFKPNGNLTNQEAVTILVRMVGLGPVVDKAGVWPTNYIGRASTEGILDDVTVVGNVKANRGDVAIMLTNSLTVDMWGADSYEDDGSVVYGKIGETLLGDRLDVTEADVRVTKYDTDDNEVTVQALEKEDKAINGSWEIAKDANIDIYNLYLNEATVWVDDDDEVIFADVDSDFFLDAIEINEDYDEVTLVDADKDYDIDEDDDDFEVYVNGDSAKLKDMADKNYDFAKVVLNDKNDVICIDAYTWSDFFVVKSSEKDVVTDLDKEELKVEDYTIFKDGKIITADDIEEDDVFFFNSSAKDGFGEVYTETVTGPIQKVYSDALRVKDNDYDYQGVYADDNAYAKHLDGDEYEDMEESIAEDMENEDDVTLYLERDGDMVYISGKVIENSNEVVGFLLKDVSTDIQFGKPYLQFKIFNEKGVKVTETVKLGDIEKITYNGKEYEDDEDGVTGFGFSGDNKTVNRKLIAKGVNEEIATVTDNLSSNVKAGAIIKFSYDENSKVEELEFIDNTDANSGYGVKALTTSIEDVKKDDYAERKELKSNTIIFNVEDDVKNDTVAPTSFDEDNMTVSKLSEAKFKKIEKANGVGDIFASKIYYNDDNEVLYIIAADTDEDADTTYHTALVTDKKVNDGDITKLTAWINGSEETLTVDKLSKTKIPEENKVYILEIQDEDNLVKAITEAHFVTANGGTTDTETIIDADNVNTRDDKINSKKLSSDAFVLDFTGRDKDIKRKYLRDVSDDDDVILVYDCDNDGNPTDFVGLVILKKEDGKPGASSNDSVVTEGSVTYCQKNAENKIFMDITKDASVTRYEVVGHAHAFVDSVSNKIINQDVTPVYADGKIVGFEYIDFGSVTAIGAVVIPNSTTFDGLTIKGGSFTSEMTVKADDVTLENVTADKVVVYNGVTGFDTKGTTNINTLELNGGGINSVTLKDSSKIVNIDVKAKVRIKLMDATKVTGTIDFKDKSAESILEVSTSNDVKEVDFTSANADNVEITGTLSKITTISNTANADLSSAVDKEVKDRENASAAVTKIDGFAKNSNAGDMTIADLQAAGATNLVDANLDDYKVAVAAATSADTTAAIQTIVDNTNDVVNAYADLTEDAIKATNADLANVKANLNLAIVGSNETSVEWNASNNSAIANTGVVTKPVYTGDVVPDVKGNVVATITKGTATKAKTFADVTVKPETLADNATGAIDKITGKNQAAWKAGVDLAGLDVKSVTTTGLERVIKLNKFTTELAISGKDLNGDDTANITGTTLKITNAAGDGNAAAQDDKSVTLTGKDFNGDSITITVNLKVE